MQARRASEYFRPPFPLIRRIEPAGIRRENSHERTEDSLAVEEVEKVPARPAKTGTESLRVLKFDSDFDDRWIPTASARYRGEYLSIQRR